jgi:hypothetical protein
MPRLFQEIRNSIGSRGITFLEDEDFAGGCLNIRWIKKGLRKSKIDLQTS